MPYKSIMNLILLNLLEEFITKVGVCLQQVGFNTSRRLHSHLGTILQDENWEDGTGHAC